MLCFRGVSYLHSDVKDTRGVQWMMPRAELSLSLYREVNFDLVDFHLCFKNNVFDDIVISTEYKFAVIGGKCHCVV